MTTPADTATPRRPVRVGHLVSGLVCLGLAGVWALWAAGLVGGHSLSRLLPAVLLVAGVAGLVAMATGARPAPAAPAAAHPPEKQHPAEPVDQTDPIDQTRPYPTQES